VARDRYPKPGDQLIALRALTDADLDELFSWESDPAAAELAAFTRPDPSDRDAFDAHYLRVRANPDVMNRAILRDGVFVGSIATFEMEGDQELTYWVDPARWGQGIASAAVEAMLTIEPRRPLFARAAEHNPGSIRVLERNGFERISWADGVGRDVVEYVYRRV
jgi:RimJ/RimL family protein N-acetyltransferase